jgi:L-lactate dehydrogenase (cytochrome)
VRLKNCYRTGDFRKLAKQRLPSPIFHYIDGGSDDEVTLARNTSAFDTVDLVPNVLAGISDIDLSVSVLGQKLDMPLFMSPTAMQRLFELGSYNHAAKFFQIYIHHDAALTSDLIARCKASNFGALALTVDTIVAGNRERDYLTGMTTPPKLTPRSLLSFSMHMRWALNYLLRDSFSLPNITGFIEAGNTVPMSVVDYLNTQVKSSISWDDAASMVEEWGGPFAIKGVMSVNDARRCVDIGASAIMISNHGGRQLDGSRSPFDQLQEILDAVGGDIEVIVDGGIRRGTHVLKAMAMGATACSGGRMYLYALAGAGSEGVDRAIGLLRDEIERDMKLMGCKSLRDLKPSMLAGRSA